MFTLIIIQFLVKSWLVPPLHVYISHWMYVKLKSHVLTAAPLVPGGKASVTKVWNILYTFKY